MFSWIVRRINDSIKVQNNDIAFCVLNLSSYRPSLTVRGRAWEYWIYTASRYLRYCTELRFTCDSFVLMQTNSFEQFMINYCNERIQQLFVDLTLCTEQQEYIREVS